MYRQEQSISLTSFLSWFKLDRKCNLAAGFCAVHNNPTVAKTWTLNRLGKTIWNCYWHFLSNVKNTRKPLVKPHLWLNRPQAEADVMFRRCTHVACGRQYEANFLEYTARCTILTAFYEDDLCTILDKLLIGKHRWKRRLRQILTLHLHDFTSTTPTHEMDCATIWADRRNSACHWK